MSANLSEEAQCPHRDGIASACAPFNHNPLQPFHVVYRNDAACWVSWQIFSYARRNVFVRHTRQHPDRTNDWHSHQLSPKPTPARTQSEVSRSVTDCSGRVGRLHVQSAKVPFCSGHLLAPRSSSYGCRRAPSPELQSRSTVGCLALEQTLLRCVELCNFPKLPVLTFATIQSKANKLLHYDATLS